ncbi:MAG: hypothetical protein H6Q90_6641 [Deltaproteobacteria bacterium]|nr:hypothetical protein [Deltaproteobacteria bacterium]
MRLLPIVIVVLLAACTETGSGGGTAFAPICQTLTECGALSGIQAEECEPAFAEAVPDSATRAVSECSACLTSHSCADINDRSCADACEPLFDALLDTPGKVSGSSCNTLSSHNIATSLGDGSLEIRLNCAFDITTINPGPLSRAGESKACGHYKAGVVDCPQASGTVQVIEKAGRRWASGSCACSNEHVEFEVPFVLAL